MLNIWNDAAALVMQGYNDVADRSREHWRSMATSVAKNVRAKRDVYSWDRQYLGTIVPVSK